MVIKNIVLSGATYNGINLLSALYEAEEKGFIRKRIV